MKYLVYFLIPIFISCATPYQKKGYRGGYTDSDLGNGIHLITVRVNSYTDAATAYEYFHRRAGELCGEYDVIELRDSERSDMARWEKAISKFKSLGYLEESNATHQNR